jgi:16S rRNA (cytidine1402-2'-O)-methyltransferase
MGQLYIVATPIGNLEDITLRALRMLGEVSLIAAEDTRTARILLRRHGLNARLVPLTDHNAARAVPRLLDALEAVDIALISEAGTPIVSDPGYELVTSAIAAGHQVIPIPGPSAVLAALVVSGLPAREFTYLGFLPHGGADRRRLLAEAAKQLRTLVVFESPHRLRAALQDMVAAFGDRPIAVCREMTKLYEEVFRGTAAQALEHFTEPRGEFTIVVSGASTREPADASAALEELAILKRNGKGAREATEVVSRRTGIARRHLYRAWHELED